VTKWERRSENDEVKAACLHFIILAYAFSLTRSRSIFLSAFIVGRSSFLYAFAARVANLSFDPV